MSSITTPQTGYAPVNGLRMYYEIHGSGGVPLLLLHGALTTIEMWGEFLSTPARTRQVIAVEFQAHGRTADIDRPFSYEQFADDAAALLRHIGVGPVDVFGYSLGAGAALQLVIRHPDLVRKLVAASASFNTEGVYPEVWEGIKEMQPEMLDQSPMHEAYQSPMHEAYLKVAPNPNDWATLIKRQVQLDSEEFAWPAEAIRAITAPTFLIFGDSDIVRPEHVAEMFRLLGGGVPGDFQAMPNAQLAILPGTTHVGVIVERASWVLPMIIAFLDAPEAAAEG